MHVIIVMPSRDCSLSSKLISSFHLLIEVENLKLISSLIYEMQLSSGMGHLKPVGSIL